MSNSNSKAVVALAIIGVVLILLLTRQNRPVDQGDGVSHQPARDVLSLATASQAISRKTRRTVVRIESVRDQSTSNNDLQQLFGEGITKLESQGTGFCIGEGIVLTNYHVVAHATDIAVKLDDVEAQATLIGYDVLTDLALLKAEGLDLTIASWGDSDRLAVGDFVWAIGNPFGLQRSVTFGIVSAVNQEGARASVLQEFMQTDAAVNPGGSGGPLVDMDGNVVGVNTAILGDTYRGISFAIPSNTARDIAEELSSAGRISRGWLGVVVSDNRSESGVLVTAFSGGPDTPSPALSAGIEIGDSIDRWNDTPVTNSVQLARLAAQTKPGNSVQIAVRRDVDELVLPVKITSRP